MELDISDQAYGSLTQQLQGLHERVREIAPAIERIACALYDPADDMLKTFINSTHNGIALRGYQYRLGDSESLSYLARTKEMRLLTDIQNQLKPTTAHSAYVLQEGFQSSYTIPLHHQGAFLAFMFFDSREKDTFSEPVRRELQIYGQILAMAIANELLAVRSILSTVMLAREFASFRDAETGAHLERIPRYARLIVRGLAATHEIADEFAEAIFLYAPLHDIGKIAIPDSILLKPGKLDADEWEIMKTHTTKGREMIDTIISDLGIDSLPNDTILRNIVELHHEAINGSGYPHGLSGDDIPLEARIVAVADVYDALTAVRPYKRASTPQEAIAELVRMVDMCKLDPECVTALRRGFEESEAIRTRYPDD